MRLGLHRTGNLKVVQYIFVSIISSLSLFFFIYIFFSPSPNRKLKDWSSNLFLSLVFLSLSFLLSHPFSFSLLSVLTFWSLMSSLSLSSPFIFSIFSSWYIFPFYISLSLANITVFHLRGQENAIGQSYYIICSTIISGL